MLMSAHNTGIDEVQIPIEQTRGISLGLQGFEHALPEACCAPAVEAARNGSDRAVALRQVSPGRTCPEHPEDAVDPHTLVSMSSGSAAP